ncbi:helix-turn-helix domain-containing protein [Sphingomonas sp. BK235]|jgi:DNA-binding HxlR family transcriptional regulator|uniref:winged helix-turn-helix transcriptional regulator n=1 Tax=Sphingomonas sp. BK235 TaxID=2512131 RepID=UPI00104C3AB5|nr:helix-turn-helix domain-containing protein [Sphingomonas sp. BK235]TCP35894.1 HxlR family transcriptional regulator [Sphingomonas sp. BK235]
MHVPAEPGVSQQCRKLSGVLTIVGDKWTVMIVMVLMGQPRRFNELKRTIGGISQQMLTRTLKALERDGMVSRTVRPTVPPQVEYALTDLGMSLAQPLQALGIWASAHLVEIEGHRHAYDTRAAA